MRIDDIQRALREEGLDGWLFFDHHGRDPLAYRVLRFEPGRMVTRRWYYFVPATGAPRGLAHKVEPKMLDALPGEKTLYAGWQQQRYALGELLRGCKAIAMQYSPECAVPYVANVDAGTVELVRSCGVEVRTSADLIQYFEARWTAEQYESHKAAGVKVDAVRRAAFVKAAGCLASGTRVTELDIKQFVLDGFAAAGLFTDHGPIVAVNSNASNPHYEPTAERHTEIRKGDLLLIDLWAKLARPGAVYYDITWTGFMGAAPPDAMLNVFAAVAGARDAAVECVQAAARQGRELRGYEVDDAARGHLQATGLAEWFFHRTGHSIGEEVHGNGANMDNYETHDIRRVIPRTCFSVEPGVYLPEFGIRSEVNVYRAESDAEVTGEIQRELLRLV
ncbi:MAG: aminopeptidase P family protein [Candidatus Solibacter usitatus]|nr:aminopeptidase P family protein [Candidatus Solibacter usitatus]